MASSERLRILAFEPFDAGSHRAVREAISRHSRHEWRWITRPGRNWKWRMRVAAAEMIDDAVAAAGEGCDALFVTSLMSVADLRGLLPARMRDVPVILYMHENQAAYPASAASREAAGGSRVERDVHFALTNLTSILAADRVVWNSAWNRDSFIEGIELLLSKGSDVWLRDVAPRIRGKSVVVWPPVEAPGDVPRIDDGAKPRGARASGGVCSGGRGERVLHNSTRVVWPHRWEHDKGPDELLDLALRHSEPFNLRWVILGERYRDVPPALREFQRRLSNRIDHMDSVESRESYWNHLRRCDWVLSTARHEFFGIAVVEALLSGCLPWLPDRLSYPELLPAVARGLSPMSPPADPDALRAAIRSHLSPAVAENAAARLDAEIEGVVVGAL